MKKWEAIFEEYTKHIMMEEYILTRDDMTKQMTYEDFVYMIYVTLNMQYNETDHTVLQDLLDRI